jgi:hypothetical protein
MSSIEDAKYVLLVCAYAITTAEKQRVVITGFEYDRIRKGLHPNCMSKKKNVRIACHVSEVYVRNYFSNFFYLFLISWDAVFYQSIFPLILTSVLPFLSIIDNISKITSYNFKVNCLYYSISTVNTLSYRYNNIVIWYWTLLNIYTYVRLHTYSLRIKF